MGSKKNNAKRKREADEESSPAALDSSDDSQHARQHARCARWGLRTPESLGFHQTELDQLCHGWYREGLGLVDLLKAQEAERLKQRIKEKGKRAMKQAKTKKKKNAKPLATADSEGATEDEDEDAVEEQREKARVEKMRGDGLQQRVEGHPYWEATEAYMRYGLESAIGTELANELPCQGMSLHVMQPGDGPQPVHADLPLGTPEADAHAASCYSVLLYTLDGPSTQLATFSAAQHDLILQSDQAKCEMLVKEYLWMTQSVSMGSLLVMRGDVYHCAPRNFTQGHRVCVYGLFSPLSLTENPAQMSTVTWPLTINGVVEL